MSIFNLHVLTVVFLKASRVEDRGPNSFLSNLQTTRKRGELLLGVRTKFISMEDYYQQKVVCYCLAVF